MEISVNGETKIVVDAISVDRLIAMLGLTGERIAVERNLEIVPQSAWECVVLQPKDRIEVINFVGGG